MARIREFDLDVAVAAAKKVFWTHGYNGTSVRMLCEAMGIQVGSFYQAFGSKDGCWEAAFARYLADLALPTTPGVPAVYSWLEFILPREDRPLGCMIVNSAVEMEFIPAAGAKIISKALASMTAFFELCMAGRNQPRADAMLLTNTVVAIHVLARARAPRPVLVAHANAALIALGLERISES